MSATGRLEPAATKTGPGLAQANVARMRAPLDSPVMRQFVDGLEVVNRIADGSAGFLWRLRSGEAHGATSLKDGEHLVFVNVSVWASYEALHTFVYRSAHGAYLRHRARWFEPIQQPSTVLWWVERERWPTVEEALQRLAFLRAHGASPQAFSLLRRFDPNGHLSVSPRPRPHQSSRSRL